MLLVDLVCLELTSLLAEHLLWSIRDSDTAEMPMGDVTVEGNLPRARWRPWEDRFQLGNSSYSQGSSVRDCLISVIGWLLERKGFLE